MERREPGLRLSCLTRRVSKALGFWIGKGELEGEALGRASTIKSKLTLVFSSFPSAKLSHPAPPTQTLQFPNLSSSRPPPPMSHPPQQQSAFIPRPAHYPPLASSQPSQFFRQRSISTHSRTSSTASNVSDLQPQPRRTSQPSQPRQPSLTSSHLPLGAQQQPIQHRQPPPSSHQPIPNPSLPYSPYHPPPGLSYPPSVVFQQPFEPPHHSSSSSSRPNPPNDGSSSSHVSLPDGWTGSLPAYASSFVSKPAPPQAAKAVPADGHGGEEKKEKKPRKPSPYNRSSFRLFRFPSP